MTITMLSNADTQLVTSAVRAMLHDLSRDIPASFQTFSPVYSAALGSRRFNPIVVVFLEL